MQLLAVYSVDRHLIMVERLVCPNDPPSYVIWSLALLVGSPLVNRSVVRDWIKHGPNSNSSFQLRKQSLPDMTDVAALSETRRSGEGQLREGGRYTFYWKWKGKAPGERRIHGVGFAIKNKIINVLSEHPIRIRERLMTLRLQLAATNIPPSSVPLPPYVLTRVRVNTRITYMYVVR